MYFTGGLNFRAFHNQNYIPAAVVVGSIKYNFLVVHNTKFFFTTVDC